MDGHWDIIVIGVGHAGCEAALAAARMGLSTLALGMNLDAVALMACNPSIGGTAKGHLVREVDALGGRMGLVADAASIQTRMINTAKGPAVQSLRAQVDKVDYQRLMKSALERQENLDLKQGEAVCILTQGGRVSGVETAEGLRLSCRAVIVASGVYLKSRVILGEKAVDSGPSGLLPANALSRSLTDLGLELRRFKTGTPMRIDGRGVDFSRMQEQPGDDPMIPFSFLNSPCAKAQRSCYLTYTGEAAHRIIRENLHRAPLYDGRIQGRGPRYCPSIEDKVVRFADKERHPIFIEPEGRETLEMYVQGMSTSLPPDVQQATLATIPGLERARIVRFGYAIEYDCIDPTALTLSLACREVPGLYLAGQVNGSSGYEEAAAQGLMAGVNAALYVKGEGPFLLGRDESYIGVLVDDLVTKGTQEPYRMMTSRAEYRLLLRQANADTRLTERAHAIGLADEERYGALMRRAQGLDTAMAALEQSRLSAGPALEQLLAEAGAGAAPPGAIGAAELIKRPNIRYAALRELDPSLPELGDEDAQEVEVRIRYRGYIQRQAKQVEEFKRMENMPLAADIDYASVSALRLEARQKLDMIKPQSYGQAARISGVSPADIAVLMVYLQKNRAKGEAT